ncbi:MAG: N5-glutamine methyltransferase family protein, partial [Candidatus Saccharimonadales bacterium]
MNVRDWLKQAKTQLEAVDVPTARLDALVLLEDAMGVNRAKLLAEPNMEISTETENVLTQQLARRATHEPLAYVRGKSEFYGREFVVSPAVLEPRPESETMIELLLQRSDLPTNPRIADVGTGSGALGITAKLELPEASVDLLDSEEDALEVAHTNVIKLTTGISLFKTDLLHKSPAEYDVLLCNLPYVPDGYAINAAAGHEPSVALFGGPDGLDLYRKLIGQLANVQNKPLLILCESLPSQHEALKALFAQHG